MDNEKAQVQEVVDFEAVSEARDGIAYASDFRLNGLFKVNFHTETCEYISMFHKEKRNGKRIHCVAKRIENKIFFIPASGENIAVFDCEKQEIEYVAIPKPIKKSGFYSETFKFIDAVLFGRNLWLVPSTYPGLIKLDIHSHKMVIYDEWVPSEGYFFRSRLCMKQESLYVPSGNNNVVLEFNLQKEKGTVHHVGKRNHGAISMCEYRGDFWLAPRMMGTAVMWNPDHNEVIEFSDYPKPFFEKGIVFSTIIRYGSRICFMPAAASCGISFQTDFFDATFEYRWKTSGDSKIVFLFENENFYYFQEIFRMTKNVRRFKINKSNGEIMAYEFRAVNAFQQKKDYMDTVQREGNAIKESSWIGLNVFLDYIRGG